MNFKELDSIKRTDYLAKVICNKKVEYIKGSVFQQNVSHIIVPSHWVEAIHEIAHWIACDPKFREMENLGLSINNEKDNIRMQYEESIAIMLTYFLYLEFFDREREVDEYLKYLLNQKNRICEKYGISKNLINSTSECLFNNLILSQDVCSIHKSED
jgi:hypothetical protein